MRLIEKRGEQWDLHCLIDLLIWSLSVERVNITFMMYEELLGVIADEVLNEYWKNGNDFIDPSIEVYDVLLLADLVASGDEISPCFVEASDFTGDNALDLIDIMALANYVIEGN